MKKISLFLIGMLFVGAVYAQAWTKLLPKEKASASYTFYDYQKAFNAYWEPYNVKAGYYYDANGNKKKALGWKQFKRWEYFWETRVDPQTGAFPTQDINAIYKQEKTLSAFKSSNELWLSQGPSSSDGGYAGIGRINVIAYHPTNANMFWVGTASGGLWVTEDGGQSWTVLNDDMQALGVSDIVIPADYATSNVIYLATGDRDAYDTRSIGLLRSADGGATWGSTGINFNTSDGGIINRVLIDPSNSNNVIITGNFGTYKGVLSSVKSGQATMSWYKSTDNIYIDMEYKPGDFTTLYGATKNGEVYVSTNAGVTWTLTQSDGNRVELAVSPAQPTWVYAVSVNDDDGLLGIYKSTNSGASFTQILDGSIAGNNLLGWDDGSDDGGQGWYDLALAASPTDANTVLLGGINTWMTTDGGTTWNMVNHWYGGFSAPAVHADKHYLGFQTSTGILFEGNDGGIYKTSDYATWTDLSNGIVNSQIYRLGVSATVPKETIVGMQDNGTKMFFNGTTWYDVKGGDGTECIIDFSNVNTQYGAYVNGQISRTTNRWYSSTDITDNIPGGADGAWVTPYIMNPKDPEILYVGYGDIWRTNDQGDSFSQISNFAGESLNALAISPSDTATLYAATYASIYRTDNSGGSWTDITGDLPVATVRIKSIAVKSNDPNTVWITMSGYSGYGVFESTNGGQSWTNISTGLPDIPCNTIVENKLNTTEMELYAGTDVGTYLKLGSNPWTLYSTGLPNVVVSELEIYYDAATPANSRLRAATYGRGLWETTLKNTGTQTGIADIEKNDIAIYPNPSSGQFKLDIGEYNGEEIPFEVRSLSGKLVYQNVLKRTSNTIQLTDLSDGVYVIQYNKNGRWYGQNLVIRK